MAKPAIPDVITVVATAYNQPISDLVEKLLAKPISKEGPAGVSIHENGYSASLVVLLVSLLESYVSRLRFVRRDEEIRGDLSTPELLGKYFPDLPTKEELVEVCLVRNVVAHNHLWHLDVSDFENQGSPAISNPKDLGFKTNKNYSQVVDISTRKTHKLQMNISPTSVNRTDVHKVFDVIWRTLKYMQVKNYSHTPLAAASVKFRGKNRKFGDLLLELKGEAGSVAP